VKVLSLCSGIGGFDLAFVRCGMEIVGQVEIDPFCLKVLAKHWPTVKRMENIFDVRGDEFGEIDLVCAGIPCQPYSCAGKRLGAADDRAIWPEIFRIIKAIHPNWIIIENVAGFVSMALDQVLADLEGEGYSTQSYNIPACGVNAPHRRDRVWIVAYSLNRRSQKRWAEGAKCLEGSPETREETGNDLSAIKESGSNVADSEGQQDRRLQQCQLQPDTRAGSQNVADSPVARSGGLSVQSGRPHEAGTDADRDGEDVFDTTSQGLPDWAGGEVERPSPLTEFERPGGREIERDFCGVSHGISHRVDRLKALGNAVIPEIPEIFGLMIQEIERGMEM
jgi:DNA (cytosine-5)-methyltransferase 1